MWRRGMVLVALDILVKIVVLAWQCAKQRPAGTIWWMMALMAAPWAPFLDKVVFASRATATVRGIMRSRVARNEMSCIMREYLKTGHQSLTTTAVVKQLPGGSEYGVPVNVFKRVLQKTRNKLSHEKEYMTRLEALELDVKKKQAAWVVSRRAMRHGPHPATRLTHKRNLRWRRLDVWTRCWTTMKGKLAADPFPPGHLSPNNDVENVSVRDLRERRLQRAYVLDRIDDCHGGDTLSQTRAKQSVPPDLCPQCQLAMRAAIETFLESSVRAHVAVYAREWLDQTRIDVSGGRLELIVDAMWEAAFVDRAALRVEDGEHEKVRDASRPVVSPLVTTRKFLTFLFLVARSLPGSCRALRPVGERVKERLHSEQWWTEYWEVVVVGLSRSQTSGTTFDDWLDELKTEALREMSVTEMKAVVELLRTKCQVRQRTGRDVHGKELAFGSLCDADGCSLHTQTTLAVSVASEV